MELVPLSKLSKFTILGFETGFLLGVTLLVLVVGFLIGLSIVSAKPIPP